MKTRNIKKKTKAWAMGHCLMIDEREYFTLKNLEIGGKIYDYHYKEDNIDKDGPEWTGQFIGYSLTDVKDSVFIKEKIIEKLNI